MAMDVVDYEIKGSEMQFVEVELDPGEAAVGEAGSMMFMDAGIAMDTVFGDGSAQQGGFFGKLLGAGKRLVTGESLFTTIYTNQATQKLRVAFAAPYPGKILPMDLRQLGGTLICQKDAFLCAARGVSLGIYFQQKLSVGFFGGEGDDFILGGADADFLLGRYETFEARLLDPGLPQARRGRPHYFPTFQRPNGERVHVAVGQLATELPTVGDPVTLRCSTQRAGLCKMPGAPVLVSPAPVLVAISVVPAPLLALGPRLYGAELPQPGPRLVVVLLRGGLDGLSAVVPYTDPDYRAARPRLALGAPGTAGGVTFVTLEDETGPVNVIVWKHVREAQRAPLLNSRLLAVQGTWQRDAGSGGQVCHLVATTLTDLTPLLGRLARQSSQSRDFH